MTLRPTSNRNGAQKLNFSKSNMAESRILKIFTLELKILKIAISTQRFQAIAMKFGAMALWRPLNTTVT